MSRRFILILLSVFFSVTLKSQCPDQSFESVSDKLQAYIYIKDFKVTFKEVVSKKDPEFITYTVVLNKDIKYRFIIENAKGSDANLIFELFGERGIIVSSYDTITQKHYSILEYNCKKTGVHYFNLSVEGKKKGCGMLVYGFKKNTDN